MTDIEREALCNEIDFLQERLSGTRNRISNSWR